MLPLLAATLGQVALGAYQSATSGAGAAEKDFENFAKQNPLAQRSKSLDDYYQQALNRYQENPYQSAQYMAAQRNADRALASRLNLGQDLGSSLSMAGKANAQYSDTLGQAGGQAEAQRNQRFGQYGQAAQLENQQDKYLYDVNQATPFNRQLGIKQMKSQAANERYNAGLNMMGSAFGNYAVGSMYSNANKPIKTPVTPPISSESTFNSWMENPSLKPTINPSFIQKTPALTPRSPYISGATPYFPNAY